MHLRIKRTSWKFIRPTTNFLRRIVTDPVTSTSSNKPIVIRSQSLKKLLIWKISWAVSFPQSGFQRGRRSWNISQRIVCFTNKPQRRCLAILSRSFSLLSLGCSYDFSRLFSANFTVTAHIYVHGIKAVAVYCNDFVVLSRWKLCY